jgi:hypothetical protein
VLHLASEKLHKVFENEERKDDEIWRKQAIQEEILL